MPFAIELTIGGVFAAIGVIWKMHHNQVNTKVKHEQRIASIESENRVQELKISHIENRNGSHELRLDRLDNAVTEINRNITKILTILEGGNNGKTTKNT
ncbi:hypothetical protein NGC32_06255 [Kluyvera cryocrescens]|uniref:hypothetical protein n=1 Tax=Kluyvera cryocrescens TaxID=580 RepID=UPI002DBC0051|nr:hypothetical protein [Kluyvera cryocrescens]MEB7712327.1 hypothetical protein [Kluyvera cryocrescens]